MINSWIWKKKYLAKLNFREAFCSHIDPKLRYDIYCWNYLTNKDEKIKKNQNMLIFNFIKKNIYMM